MKLVLLPGLDGTGVLFRPFVRELPRQLESIVVSYPTRIQRVKPVAVTRIRASHMILKTQPRAAADASAAFLQSHSNDRVA